MSDPRELTANEAAAIRSLERLAGRWPQSLTLASLGGSLIVFPTDAPMVTHSGDCPGIDPDQVVCWSGARIPNTGGDW